MLTLKCQNRTMTNVQPSETAELRKSILARRRKGTALTLTELLAALQLMDPALRVEVEHEWGAPFTITQVREEPDSVVFVIVDGRRP
jgi:hypothetical protein